MTQEELTQLKKDGADMEENGYSEDHKKRFVRDLNPTEKILLTLHCRLAKRYHKKRVYDTMINQFQEMGMTSVVFVCYRDTDGKPVVNWYLIKLHIHQKLIIVISIVLIVLPS